jgi:ribosomal protein L5
VARLRDQYFADVRETLRENLGITNDHALPRLMKITVSCGVGGAKDNKKLLENAIGILERVTGQKAVSTRARKSIEQSVFPEVDGELLEEPQGMNIALTIRSQSDEHSIALLEAYNFPFRREEVASVG